MTNLVQGVVAKERRGDLAVVGVDAEHRVATRTECTPGTRVWIGIRPEHLKLDVGRGAVDPIGKGVVRGVVNDGVAVSVQVDWAGTEFRTHLMAGRGLARTLRAGVSVSLSVSPKHVHLIPVTPSI
jgi:ABC-type Fe3+/spermidine/putrescine transport system ATPase subunit